MISKRALETSILVSCLCAAAGCGQEDPPFEIPLGQDLPPLAYSFQLSFADAPPLAFAQPWDGLEGSLHLQVNKDGMVTGVLAVHAYQTDRRWLLPHGVMTPITGRVRRTEQGTEIVFSTVDLLSEQQATYRANAMRITLEDADGDGQADSGSGSAQGLWRALYPEYGGYYDEALFTASLSLSLDDSADPARLSASRQGPLSGGDVIPPAVIEVAFSEPVRESEVAAMVRLAADHVPLESTMVTNAMDGLLTHVTLIPAEALPFGAQIIVDLGRLTDLAGNYIVEGTPLYTIGDPGSLLNDADFESEITSWVTQGRAGIEADTLGMDTVQGERHGVARAPWGIDQEDSALVAYLDVPDNALALDLAVTVLFESLMTDDYSATLTLHAAGREPLVVFKGRSEQLGSGPCVECGSDWQRIGPKRHEIDLRDHRGTRIWLMATAHARVVDSLLNPVIAMAIDDLRVIEEIEDMPPESLRR